MMATHGADPPGFGSRSRQQRKSHNRKNLAPRQSSLSDLSRGPKILGQEAHLGLTPPGQLARLASDPPP